MKRGRSQTLQGTAKVWFRFLQLAIRANLEIDWSYYAAWGSEENLRNATFASWWRSTGHRLFTVQARQVTVVSLERDAVVISIPHGLTRDQALEQVRALLGEVLPKGSRNNALEFAPSGRVNLDALNRYQRMLEIDLASTDSKLPFKRKLEALERKYAKNKERLEKQLKTMRAKGNKKGLHLPRVDKLTGKERLTGIQFQAPDPRTAYRWLTQGRIIMRNVANGSFPGQEYYQKQGRRSLGEVLTSRQPGKQPED